MAIMLGACTFPPLITPSPTPSPSATPATPSPTITASMDPPSAVPTPEPSLTPDFDAGEIVATAIDGLRVRTGPGADRPVAAGLLPLAFELRVLLGPIRVDELGWYLVADADAREPDFDEAWVAAGSEPDPFLVGTGRVDEASLAVTSMAQVGNAEQGPVSIGSGDHAIRWVALDPDRSRCDFAVSMTPAGGGEPLPAIRATVGSGIDRGTLQPQSFAALGVRGDAFIMVASDCAWALVVERVVPRPTPSASPQS